MSTEEEKLDKIRKVYPGVDDAAIKGMLKRMVEFEAEEAAKTANRNNPEPIQQDLPSRPGINKGKTL